MNDLEKTAVFHTFRAGALDELEKIASDQGLTTLEKVAFLGHVGKFLGGLASKGGAAIGRRGTQAMEAAAMKGGGWAGVKQPMSVGAGQRLGRAGEWMVANPRAAGAMGLGAAAAPLAAGGAFAAGGAAGEAHGGARRAVRG